MKLFSYCEGEETNIGIEVDDTLLNLTKALDIYQQTKGIKNAMSFTFLQVFVELGYCQGEAIRQILNDSWVKAKISELQIPPDISYNIPISRPSKIIAIGRNYRAHIKELKHETPDEPIFFCKAPSSLLAHEGQIVIPGWLDGRVDHEAELAVVIGKQARNISAEETAEYIAGYSIVNDVTARAMQKTDIESGNPWYRSKSIDTFCPMGPVLVPADEIKDPHKLQITLKVNNDTRQDASTESMIFHIPELVSYISKYMTLEPADVIATGTPSGVSPIKDGDVIEVSISEIGTLRNTVVLDRNQFK